MKKTITAFSIIISMFVFAFLLTTHKTEASFWDNFSIDIGFGIGIDSGYGYNDYGYDDYGYDDDYYYDNSYPAYYGYDDSYYYDYYGYNSQYSNAISPTYGVYDTGNVPYGYAYNGCNRGCNNYGYNSTNWTH